MHKQLLTATALFLSLSSAHAAESANKWRPTFELEGRFNSDRSLASPKMLIPLRQDSNSMLFTDIRTRLDNRDSEEYNLALGYREIHNGWIYGGYAFADYLSSANNFGYWQGTAGFEMLSEKWDVRMNGYLPQSTENTLGLAGGSGSTLGIDTGGNFSLTTTSGGLLRERAMPGFDAEVGYKLPVDAVDMRIFGGAYYFHADGFRTVAGPKARIELTLNQDHASYLHDGKEITLGAQFQNDGPREGIATALAQVRIPFGSSDTSRPPLSRLERRITNFIERDVDIVAAEGNASGGSTTTELADVELNRQTYSRGALIDANTADINGALTTAGTNALIVFDGSQGSIAAATTINPLAGQTLTGGATNVTATGRTSGLTTVATLGSTRPTVIGASGQNAFGITSAAGTTLQHMDIQADSLVNAVYALNSNNVTLNDLTVSGGSTGIYFNNSDDALLNNITATSTDAGSAAVHILNSDRATLTDMTAHGVERGIYFDGANQATVSNSTADATYGFHFNASSNISVNNAHASGVNAGFYLTTVTNALFADTTASATGQGFLVIDSDTIDLGNAYVDTASNAVYTLTSTNVSGNVTVGAGVSNSCANVSSSGSLVVDGAPCL